MGLILASIDEANIYVVLIFLYLIDMSILLVLVHNYHKLGLVFIRKNNLNSYSENPYFKFFLPIVITGLLLLISIIYFIIEGFKIRLF